MRPVPRKWCGILAHEIEDDSEVKISLCSDCAVHSELKTLVEDDSCQGLCALCGRFDVQVRNTENLEPMIMLIRSLIRFFWDEFEYNPHWGGDSVLSLLSSPDNPVVRPPEVDEHLDAFIELLEWPPYPPANEGVAVYAGFDGDGTRYMNCAISKTDPAEFRKLQRRLRHENFFDVEPALEAMIDNFIDDVALELSENEVWFRARKGCQATYQRFDGGFGNNVVRQPWMGKDIGAPSPLIASAGRLNRQGISVLYLASDAYTAVAEIRPHPGHYVSVGGFRSVAAFKVADFDPPITRFSSNDDRLDLYATIQAFDRLMSTPVTPDEKTPYLLTQLLSEVLLRKGFDGVRFRSSVSSGSNICIFRPSTFEFSDTHSQVMGVANVTYDTPAVPSVTVPNLDELHL